jgi:hypothetical protein
MLGAAAAALRFCCPECGCVLAAPRSDGGTSLTCHLCGERVRVPARPHPLESGDDTGPLVPPEAVTAAASGLRLLSVSLWLAAVEHLTLIGVIGYWVSEVGPARVLARDLGGLGPLLAAAWLFDLTLLSARTALRWVGYHRCGPAAAVVRAEGPISVGRVAVLFRLAGYALVPLPWLIGWSADRAPIGLIAVSQVGLICWLVGSVGEFGVLAGWYRLLAHTAGPVAAQRATRYLVWTGCGLLIGATATTLFAMTFGLAARRTAVTTGPRAGVDWAALPADAWAGAGVLAGVMLAVAFALGAVYARLLATVRSGLTGR